MSTPTSRPSGQLQRFWPLLVPILWCLASQLIMDSHALIQSPEVDRDIKFFIYDESDLTAMALRGANSKLGRLPGRRDEPAWWANLEHLEECLDAPQPPLQERFYLEYPTTSLLIFRLGYGNVEAGKFPSTVLDGQQYYIANHKPRHEAERQVWQLMNHAVRTYIIIMTLGLLALMLVMAWGYGTVDAPGGSIWLLALPGAVYFSLNRFDVLPALAVAMSFACLGRRYLFWAGAFLALGVLLKVYPVLLLPVILRYLGIWKGSRCFLGFTITMATGIALSTYLLDWESTIAPIQVQMNRAVEENNWIFYGRLLPLELAYWKTGRTGLVVLTVLAMCLTRPSNISSILRRSIVILLVFNALAVFWSPQWMIWFLPLLVPLSRQNRWALGAMVLLDLVNYFSFPCVFFLCFSYCHPIITTLLILMTIGIRGLYTVVIPAIMVWELFRDSNWNQRRRVQDFQENRIGTYEPMLLKLVQEEQTPKGLRIVSLTSVGEPVAVRSENGELALLIAAELQPEPIPGSEMEGVPQASETRTVTAMYRYERLAWDPVRVIFNLSPEQVIERSAGQLTPLNLYPK